MNFTTSYYLNSLRFSQVELVVVDYSEQSLLHYSPQTSVIDGQS